MKNNTSTPLADENPITPNIQKHIEAVAAGMIGHSNLVPDDFPDLCQELSFQVIKAADSYSPEDGSFYTFAQTVIHRHRDRIFRYRMRRGLDCPTVSIDAMTKNECNETIPLVESVSYKLAREQELKQEWREMVRDVVRSLEPRLQAVCALLMDGKTKKEVCSKLNLSPRSLYRDLEEIRSAFKQSPLFRKTGKTIFAKGK